MSPSQFRQFNETYQSINTHYARKPLRKEGDRNSSDVAADCFVGRVVVLGARLGFDHLEGPIHGHPGLPGSHDGLHLRAKQHIPPEQLLWVPAHGAAG